MPNTRVGKTAGSPCAVRSHSRPIPRWLSRWELGSSAPDNVELAVLVEVRENASLARLDSGCAALGFGKRAIALAQQDG
jgi:hypothetical protein